MNSTKRLISLSIALLCAAALVPAVASADVERGSYTGSTSQPAGAAPFKGKFEISLGHLSDPPRVFSIKLTATLACEDGSSRNLRYAEVIYGPELDGKHRFSYRDGGLEVQGRFNSKGKAHGTFSYAVDTCSISGGKWKAAS
jgi:hypothetical protein